MIDDNEADFVNERAIKPLIDILTKENNADAQTLASMTLENLSTNRTSFNVPSFLMVELTPL